MHQFQKGDVLREARRVIRVEAAAVSHLTIDQDQFIAAVRLIQDCGENVGNVVTTGIGKSGLVAQRIAATLNVTGTPAWYLHPADAMHGDVGLMNPILDLLLVVSRSGEGTEIMAVLDFVEQERNLTQSKTALSIVITAAPDSSLARRATVVLLHASDEACSYGLTPTTTVTLASVLGDALALSLQQLTGFGPAQFANLHGKGNLGRRLSLAVKAIMVTGADVGHLNMQATVLEAMVLLATKRGTLVIGHVATERGTGTMEGVVTAGDVARFVGAQTRFDPVWDVPVTTIMSEHAQTTTPECLVVEAIHQMEDAGVMALPVLNERAQVVGMVHLHDALKAKVL